MSCLSGAEAGKEQGGYVTRLAIEGHMENPRVGLAGLELYLVDGEDASTDFQQRQFSIPDIEPRGLCQCQQGLEF